jgi:hypothetical protein
MRDETNFNLTYKIIDIDEFNNENHHHHIVHYDLFLNIKIPMDGFYPFPVRILCPLQPTTVHFSPFFISHSGSCLSPDL